MFNKITSEILVENSIILTFILLFQGKTLILK